MDLQTKSSLSPSNACLQNSLLLDLVFQACVPSDATAYSLIPSSHFSSVFLLFLSLCEFFVELFENMPIYNIYERQEQMRITFRDLN